MRRNLSFWTTRNPTVILSDRQIRSFRENGFLTLESITTPDEVALLRRVLDRLQRTRAGFSEGAHFDLLGDETNGETAKVLQIMNPDNYAPELRNTLFRANARAIAKQLLGEKAFFSFEHAVLKPARDGRATPWHQDEAYRADPNFDYCQIGFWMPLQRATLENGCMQYLPGTHQGSVLAHHSPNSDQKIHAIECCSDFNPADAIACPLPSGGCVIHDGRTLHCSGPNRSDVPRWAYILNFDLPPTRRTEKREFPWNNGKQSTDLLRRRAWLRRGGLIVESWRMLRRGLPLLSRAGYLMRRAWYWLVHR